MVSFSFSFFYITIIFFHLFSRASLYIIWTSSPLFTVRSLGTEDREVEKYIAPRNEKYEFIVFRGQDIKDLTVGEPKREEQMNSQPPQDPAIVQVHTCSCCTLKQNGNCVDCLEVTFKNVWFRVSTCTKYKQQRFSVLAFVQLIYFLLQSLYVCKFFHPSKRRSWSTKGAYIVLNLKLLY